MKDILTIPSFFTFDFSTEYILMVCYYIFYYTCYYQDNDYYFLLSLTLCVLLLLFYSFNLHPHQNRPGFEYFP